MKWIIVALCGLISFIIECMIFKIISLPFYSMELQFELLYVVFIFLFIILIMIPILESINKRILIINICVLILMISTMNVDYQVIRIFSLLDIDPSIIPDVVWDKSYNLYWVAWVNQMGIVFLIFGLIYRLQTKNTWASARISIIGPLMAFFSIEDIIYYPMHGRNPFEITSWPWLPQHNIYFGRPVTTPELIWIVSISMILIFLFLILPAFIKKSKNKQINNKPTPKKQKLKCIFFGLLSIPAIIIFILFYLSCRIINDRIPIIIMFEFLIFITLLILFVIHFPVIKSKIKQLLLIFTCYMIFWIVGAEMDWNAVEAGFHWIIPSSISIPLDEFWNLCHYRIAMWMIYLPVILILISIIFKSLSQSKYDTLKLTITNFCILLSGLDSVIIYVLNRFEFPYRWTWSNIHYSILNGLFSIFTLICINVVIFGIIYFMFYYKSNKKIEK